MLNLHLYLYHVQSHMQKAQFTSTNILKLSLVVIYTVKHIMYSVAQKNWIVKKLHKTALLIFENVE